MTSFNEYNVERVLGRSYGAMRRSLIGLAVDLGVGLLVVLIAYLAGKNLATVLIAGVIACFATALLLLIMGSKPVTSRLPRPSVERGDGFVIRVRPPEHGGKHRLRQHTTALVKDIRDFLKTQPAPHIESVREHTEMTRRMQNVAEEERTAIWNEYTQKMTERTARETQNLAERFGGRLRYVSLEYQRRGLLSESDARQMQWMANSVGWLAQAANELEALALRL